MRGEAELENELRERPLGEVARALTADLSLLVRQEIELARVELADKGRKAAPAGGMFGGAAAVALCAAGALTAFLVLVLALALPDWAAALLVGVALAVLAGVLVLQGRARLAQVGAPLPEQAIETTKEDIEWAKTRASSARR